MPANAVAAAGGAAAAAGGGGGGGGGRQQEQGNPFMSMIRMAMFWYFLSNWLFKKPPPQDPKMLMRNLFQKGEYLDMWVYLSEEPSFTDFRNEHALVWHETDIPYAEYGAASRRVQHHTFTTSQAVQHNGSVYAHMFFTRSGYSPDPTDPAYDRTATFSRIHPLVVYYPRPKDDKRKKLIGSREEGDGEAEGKGARVLAEGKDAEEKEQEDEDRDEDDEEDEYGSGSSKTAASDPQQPQPEEWISFWKPNLTISLVDDFSVYPINKVPDIFAKYMQFDPAAGGYFPTVYPNDFWLLRDKLVPVNSTVDELALSMALETLPAWQWQLYLTMEQSFKIQQSYGATVEGEADQLKRVFLEGNPVLLAVTFVVSILHSVFDFFAFKNDIAFWNANKSMEGLSARTVVVNFVCQLIIFLYLLDNETSWMILISAGISVGIEFWKIGKAMHVEVDRSGRFPMLRFRDRESYAQNKTKEYDALAMRYLSYALYPLVACYAAYSLMYDTHRSWYSWVLSSLTGCVYTFGFIMMCPQLFINYKLKSVAHLPWRQMTYKFLNTIIDDLFAFVIKMPTLHRLSVFRDDIIFLIFLYQRWIYPVDKKRVNEFGFGGEEPAAAVGALQEGQQQAPAALESAAADKNGKTGGSSSSGKSRSVSERGLSRRAATSTTSGSSDVAPTEAGTDQHQDGSKKSS